MKCSATTLCCWLFWQLFVPTATGFVAHSHSGKNYATIPLQQHNQQRYIASWRAANGASRPLRVSAAVDGGSSPSPLKKKKSWKELRAEGGPLTINTPIGALNPFALYYGFISLALGLPWLVSLKACQFLYWITRGRFDPKVSTKSLQYWRDMFYVDDTNDQPISPMFLC